MTIKEAITQLECLKTDVIVDNVWRIDPEATVPALEVEALDLAIALFRFIDEEENNDDT